MNVLICGRQSGFCRQLADRLAREKHEVYYLSGNKKEESLSKNVFQEYHFDYLNENINHIIVSARPDTMIISGSADQNYNWRDPEKNATEFVTGMMRLFLAAQSEGVRRVIFISSTEIFQNNEEEVITSSTEPRTESIRLSSFVRSEKLLREMAEAGQGSTELIILRLPLVIGDNHESIALDYCLHATQSYLYKGVVPCAGAVTHAAMHFRDAAEAVLRCTELARSEEVRVFQLRGLIFTESEVAQTLLESKWYKEGSAEKRSPETEAVQQTFCPCEHIDRADEAALSFSLRYELKEALNLLCKTCLKSRKDENTGGKNRIQLLPVLESLALGLLSYVLSLWLQGSWVGEALNLFTIYVLIFAVSYGTSHGLFAALLGGCGMMLLMSRESSFAEIISDYVFYLRVWELILIAVIAGLMRDKYSRKNKGLSEENAYLNNELNDISLINENNAYVKNVYEKRLLSYENSLSQIYELTTRLDFMESQKVVFQAVHMVSDLMQMGNVAIYTASRKNGFLRLSASTSALAASCGNSLYYDRDSFLYESLSQGRIYLNRELEGNRPTFAGAICSDDEMLAVVFVWTDDLRQVNLYASDMLAIACHMIEKSVSRALIYENALRNDTYEGELNIMKKDSFIKMLGIYEDGFQQGLLDYSTLVLNLNGHSIEDAVSLIRDTDYVGLVDSVPCVILSQTGADMARLVCNRFEERGIGAVPVEPLKLLSGSAEWLPEACEMMEEME